MNGDQPISWLMFFTLAAGIVIVGFVFLNFIRSRSNREVAANTLEGNAPARGAAADGALPELAGLTVFALIAMSLLTAGFAYNPGEKVAAEASTPAASNSVTTTGMSQPKNIQNEPKRYQPNNPGTDTRTSPTGSDTGVGNSPGSTGTLTK
ncbi:conserved hypothetical protein [Rhodopseudomonas palustris TIE-1]|uniref:hypothetical protein n=1 Tax=Rhodopseudomonas palustris TaxID=1076 RepID=UPI000164B748|nr:hypothetical protein [Rhodopseudomonas palustris]ACF00214.1 conserved hypothetical protein [Rhodopseudomonas palustris TIE-1]